MEQREIKFRAWDKKRKVMLRSFDDINDEDGDDNEKDEWYSTLWGVFTGALADVLKRFILMEYISLKDRNKREIYEGDIMQHPDDLEKAYYVVRFGETVDERVGFYLEGRAGLIGDFQGFEVVGNIYENPKLLK